MQSREYAKTQIDILPETEIEKVIEFISFRKYSIGLFENDTDYLMSIPGMVDSIKAAAAEPLGDGIDASEVNFDV
jgi:hypothetical protein